MCISDICKSVAVEFKKVLVFIGIGLFEPLPTSV